MRIAIGQLWQETNTFNPTPTTVDDFVHFGASRGAAMVEAMARTNELGGFIQSLRSWPEAPEIVGLARLPAWPGGRATEATFRWLRDEMTAALDAAGPVDAVLVALHGAMAADGHPDVEGEILELIRGRVGRGTPLVATLDLHANVTRRMVDQADVLLLYHTAPHVDVYETGQRGAAVLRRILIDGARPTTAFVKIPATIPAELANTQAASGASVDFKRRLQELERRDDVLAAGLATVQPWLDVPEFGSAALVTTVDRPELAAELAGEVALQFWSRRREFLPTLTTIEEAIRAAQANTTERVVVLSDAADATTSGAPGDSVWILRELLKVDWPRPALATLVSPELTARADAMAPGERLETELGGVRDHRFGVRMPFAGELERTFDARFVLNGHLGKNMPIDMGRGAVLRSGATRVIVTARSGPHFAPELFQAAGFDPFAASVLVAKSPCGFRAVYAPHAAAIFNVRSPGCAPTDFWNYPYAEIERPIWPWDELDFSPRMQ